VFKTYVKEIFINKFNNYFRRKIKNLNNMDFLTDLLTSTYATYSVAAWSTFLIILGLYWGLEYKTKSSVSDFSFGYWVKDNWLNVVVSAAFFWMYNNNQSGTVTFATLAFIATAPNILIDWIQTLRYQAKVGK
jgi:hypothetical protein